MVRSFCAVRWAAAPAGARAARRPGAWRRAASCILALGFSAPFTFAAGAPYVVAQQQPVAEQFDAFGDVEPMAAVSVQAITPGVVANLAVVPGTKVKRGQKLAVLTGPEATAALTRARTAVQSAAVRLAAARKVLAVNRQQLASHLTTEQQVLQAESSVADAAGALATARAELTSVEGTTTLTATTDGTVLAVPVANGQRVATGDVILTLAPANGLALKATVYGTDAATIHVGMKGAFTPDDGDGRANPPGELRPHLRQASGGQVTGQPTSAQAIRATIPVVVAAVSTAADGGATVWLRPEDATASWRNGQFGTITVDGPTRSLVAVPSRALILDQGRWWVLVQTAAGEQRQEVVPGPTRGWDTFIERGLAPGARVIVTNAYLEFHRDISAKYQAPD